MIKKAFLVGTLVCYSASSLTAEVLRGNSDVPQQSFTFTIGTQELYNPTGRLFIGAADAVSKNDYAVAAITRHGNSFKGLTPEKVRLNYQNDSINPVHGAAISHLALLASRPVVSIKSDPSSLFLIDDVMSPISVFQAKNIHDVQGKDAQALLALTTSAPAVMTALDAGSSLAALAAIGNENGGFDGDGSGIALLFFKRFTDREKKTFHAWDIVDAVTGASQFDTFGKSTATGNKAFPIGKDTPEIAIQNAVTSIGTAVDLFFDRDLGRLYGALQVVAGPGAQDGARALFVASLTNGRLLLQPIVPDSAVDDNDKIVAGRGPNVPISLYKVRTMQTTTYLRYLVVVGGNGDTGKRKVFALPLVDNVKDAAHGTLADVTSKPVTLFSEQKPYRFLARVFTQGATKPQDLYTMRSRAAKVGGDGELPGPITDISVNADAVFVSVDEDGNVLKAGIFHSQALFDHWGRIKKWTPWQRAAGADEKIALFSYDPYKGQFLYTPMSARRVNAPEASTILRTTFTDGSDPLGIFVSKALSQSTGGVQGFLDFPFSTPGFTAQSGQRLSVNVFTGFESVVLMQAGADGEGGFGPLRRLLSPLESIDGSLKGFKNQPTLVLSGGALADIGPIGSCAVLTDETYGWFIVGGSNGIAVLADEAGRGWDALTGLGTNFQGLSERMSFKKISGIANVRKLIAVENRLFVLTDKIVARLALDAPTIMQRGLQLAAGEQEPSYATLTQRSEEQSFSDLIISGPLALLATSSGLLRSGNAVDIQTVSTGELVEWTQVLLPEAAGSFTAPGPVTRLFALSPTGFETDVAHGGTIFALNGAVSMSEAQIYRFVIQLHKGAVTNKTVRLFPDLFILRKPTFFASLGDYRNYVVTDGALIAVSRSAFGTCLPLLELLAPTLKSGQPVGARSRVAFTTFKAPAVSVGQMLRDSASGSWMIPGDFGIRIQQ